MAPKQAMKLMKAKKVLRPMKVMAGKMARKTFAKAAAMVMKRPAMCKAVGDGESEEEVDDEDCVANAMKRPAAAMKRPAAAGQAAEESEGEENEDEGEAEEETPNLSVEQLHRSSMKEVNKKRRAIEKLERSKEALAAKMKGANAQIRTLQRELESSEAVARKHGSAVSRKRSVKKRAFREKQVARAERARIASARKAKVANKRVKATKKAMEALQQKGGLVESMMKKTQAHYAETVKKCKELTKQGYDVPAPGDTSSWSFCAKNAWLDPEVEAARARYEAKQALQKAEEAYKKWAGPLAVKKEALLNAKKKLEEVKDKRKSADEVIGSTVSMKSKRKINAKAMKVKFSKMAKAMKSRR